MALRSESDSETSTKGKEFKNCDCVPQSSYRGDYHAPGNKGRACKGAEKGTMSGIRYLYVAWRKRQHVEVPKQQD